MSYLDVLNIAYDDKDTSWKFIWHEAWMDGHEDRTPFLLMEDVYTDTHMEGYSAMDAHGGEFPPAGCTCHACAYIRWHGDLVLSLMEG